jgi:hypothetical protein
MSPLPQTAGGQSRFPCEPELMIRAVNVVLTATRLDVAVARGRSYTIRRSASRTSSLSVHESSCKAKDDAPAPNDALGPLSLDWTLLAAGAGWSNHTLGVPDAKPSVPPPAVRRRDRQVCGWDARRAEGGRIPDSHAPCGARRHSVRQRHARYPASSARQPARS